MLEELDELGILVELADRARAIARVFFVNLARRWWTLHPWHRLRLITRICTMTSQWLQIIYLVDTLLRLLPVEHRMRLVSFKLLSTCN